MQNFGADVKGNETELTTPHKIKNQNHQQEQTDDIDDDEDDFFVVEIFPCCSEKCGCGCRCSSSLKSFIPIWGILTVIIWYWYCACFLKTLLSRKIDRDTGEMKIEFNWSTMKFEKLNYIDFWRKLNQLTDDAQTQLSAAEIKWNAAIQWRKTEKLKREAKEFWDEFGLISELFNANNGWTNLDQDWDPSANVTDQMHYFTQAEHQERVQRRSESLYRKYFKNKTKQYYSDLESRGPQRKYQKRYELLRRVSGNKNQNNVEIQNQKSEQQGQRYFENEDTQVIEDPDANLNQLPGDEGAARPQVDSGAPQIMNTARKGQKNQTDETHPNSTNKLNVVFFNMAHSGHVNATLPLVKLLTTSRYKKADVNLTYFTERDWYYHLYHKIEQAGGDKVRVEFYRTDQGQLQEVQGTNRDVLLTESGSEKDQQSNSKDNQSRKSQSHEQYVFSMVGKRRIHHERELHAATVKMLPGLLKRMMQLKPDVIIFDSSSIWGKYVGKLLGDIPTFCSSTMSIQWHWDYAKHVWYRPETVWSVKALSQLHNPEWRMTDVTLDDYYAYADPPWKTFVYVSPLFQFGFGVVENTNRNSNTFTYGDIMERDPSAHFFPRDINVQAASTNYTKQFNQKANSSSELLLEWERQHTRLKEKLKSQSEQAQQAQLTENQTEKPYIFTQQEIQKKWNEIKMKHQIFEFIGSPFAQLEKQAYKPPLTWMEKELLEDIRAAMGTRTEKKKKLIYISMGTEMSVGLDFWHDIVFKALNWPPFNSGEFIVVCALGRDENSQLRTGIYYSDQRYQDQIAIPGHFIVAPIVPQLEILKTYADLMVTHGGLNSISEALSHGVPLVVRQRDGLQSATPNVYFDPFGARVAKLLKAGVLLPEKLTAQSFRKTLETVFFGTSTTNGGKAEGDGEVEVISVYDQLKKAAVRYQKEQQKDLQSQQISGVQSAVEQIIQAGLDYKRKVENK